MCLINNNIIEVENKEKNKKLLQISNMCVKI